MQAYYGVAECCAVWQLGDSAEMPDKQIRVSEWCHMQGGRDPGMESALVTAQTMQEDLTLLNAAAWQPFTTLHPVVFTVSPIRHMADGAHGNQLSKSTLLLSVEQLLNFCPDWHYFNSYEILMDELRDYRFYARDMCHPSDLAVDIVWQRFQDTYMSPQTQSRCRQEEKAARQALHRPILQQ